MMVVVDIDGFIVKRILVDSGSSFNVLTWKAAMALQVNLEKLKKFKTPLVGIKGKLVKVERSVELPNLP